MKYLALILICVVAYSCSNELNVIEPKKDIPIVYGFMDASEDDQYLRIERAFVDESISALDLAIIPDSLYYPEDIKVQIQNNTTGLLVELVRIDGNEVGFVREEGAFAQAPNYLYKLNGSDLSLDEASTYTLMIDRGDEALPIVTAETSIVGNARFITPNPNNPAVVIHFGFNEKTNFSWSQSANAAAYDVYLDINYKEKIGDGSFDDKSVTWQMASSISTNNHKQTGQEFYTNLARLIEANPDAERRFISFDINIIGANNQLREYLRVGQANLGITSTQDVPVYTNLSEGRGIFASKFTSSLEGIKISSVTEDSLVNGIVTQDLNFEF